MSSKMAVTQPDDLSGTEHLLDLGHSWVEIIQTKGHIRNINWTIGYRIHQKLCDLQPHSHPKTNAQICLDICHGLNSSKRNPQRSQLCFPSALPGLLDALLYRHNSSHRLSLTFDLGPRPDDGRRSE